MATVTSTVVLGFTSLAQLIVTSDLLALFSKASSHFPSTEVKHVLIYTLIVAVWTFVLSLLLPFAYRDAAIYGTSNSAASNSLFVTLLLETVGAGLVTKASGHGGACIDADSSTCHLFTAVLGLQWVLFGLTLLTMLLSSMYTAHIRPSDRPMAFVPAL